MLEPTANNIVSYRDELMQLSNQAFDTISHIQRVLLFPKVANLAEIKKRYGIPMSVPELSLDLKHPYSRVRRSLNAMISEFFILQEMIEEQINRTARIASMKRKLSRLEAALATRADSSRVDEYQQRLDAIMAEIEKIHREIDYIDFKISLENFDVFRQQELDAFETMFGDDKSLHQKVAPLFKQRLNKAQGYLQNFKNKINDPKTSLAEKKNLQKQQKKFIKHLQDAKVENMLKRVPGYKDLATNEETAEGVVRKGMVVDEMMGATAPEFEEKSSWRKDIIDNNTLPDILNAGGLERMSKFPDHESTDNNSAYYSQEFKQQIAWPYANLLDIIQNGLEKLSEADFMAIQQDAPALQRLIELSDDCYDLKASQDELMIPAIEKKLEAIVRDENSHSALRPIVEAVTAWQQKNNITNVATEAFKEQFIQLHKLLEESCQDNEDISGADLEKLQGCIQCIIQLAGKSEFDSADRIDVENLKADITMLAASYGDDDERLMTAMSVSETIKFTLKSKQTDDESTPSSKPSP